MKKRIIKVLLPIAIIIGWELISLTIDNQWKLPLLENIISILADPTKRLLGTGSLIENTYFSLERVFLGFALASGIGIPLGIGMGWWTRIGDIFDYTIEVLRPIPPLAWIPLILAWFGLGLRSSIIIIFIGAFFPILVNTIEGVKNVNTGLIDVAKTFKAGEYQILKKIVIPSAAPYIVTGLRIGMGIAWMCLVAAEMMPGIAPSGLGYLIWQANYIGNVSIIIAGIVYIGVLGLVIDRTFKFIEKRYFSWRNVKHT